MTLAERLKKFQDRGFRAETAAVLVLIEETLHSLFTTFPDTFVLVGGATLVLFYGSQRHSGDIDLLVDVSQTSAVMKTELIEQPILTDEAIVRYPTRNLLLLHKAEAFLGRKNVKCRDAFDINMLRDSGAELNGNLKFHLQDGVVSDRLEDPDFIRQRIAAVTRKRCEAELQQYLPEEIYRQLAQNEFESLRESLRDLFAEWLEQ